MNEARGDRKCKRERKRNLSVEIPLETESVKEPELVEEEQIEEMEIESALETTIEEDGDISEEEPPGTTEQEHEGFAKPTTYWNREILKKPSPSRRSIGVHNDALELYKKLIIKELSKHIK